MTTATSSTSTVTASAIADIAQLATICYDLTIVGGRQPKKATAMLRLKLIILAAIIKSGRRTTVDPRSGRHR